MHRYNIEGLDLVLNVRIGVLTRLEQGAIASQERFSPIESAILAALLGSCHDGYCPNEWLFAAYRGISVEQARPAVLTAIEHGSLDLVMHQVRSVLWRCRVKLQGIGIKVESIYQTGYRVVLSEGPELTLVNSSPTGKLPPRTV